VPPGAQPIRYGRRSRRPLRATRFISPSRIGGLALMIVCAVLIGWLVTSDEFAVDESRVEMSGLGFTSESLVRSTTGLDPADGPNVFLVPTQEYERALAALPHVADAEVSAVLPDGLMIEITERSPVLIIRRPGYHYQHIKLQNRFGNL
jgi:cell division septal protein FtsQ